jgi:hypothetical protein
VRSRRYTPLRTFCYPRTVIYPAGLARYGDAMLNHAIGYTSACKPPFGAGAVARVVN